MPKAKYMLKGRHASDWTANDAVRYLQARGIPAAETEKLWGIKRTVDRIEAAAHLFASHGFWTFSTMDIAFAALAEQLEDKGYRNIEGLVSATVNYMLKEEKGMLGELCMPPMHLLRVGAGIPSELQRAFGYEIVDKKLVKTGEKPYPELKASNYDWMRGIRLPLPGDTSPETARAIGYLWARGALVRNGDAYDIQVTGKERHVETLEHAVKPALDNLFVMQHGQADGHGFTLKPYAREGKDLSGHKKIYGELEGAGIEMQSEAICTYLQHLGMSAERRDNGKPNIAMTSQQERAFLEAVIELDGRVYLRHDKSGRSPYLTCAVIGLGKGEADFIKDLQTRAGIPKVDTFKGYRGGKSGGTRALMQGISPGNLSMWAKYIMPEQETRR